MHHPPEHVQVGVDLLQQAVLILIQHFPKLIPFPFRVILDDHMLGPAVVAVLKAHPVSQFQRGANLHGIIIVDALDPAQAVITGFPALIVDPPVLEILIQHAVHAPRPGQRCQELPGSGVKTGFGKPRLWWTARPNRAPADKQTCHQDHFSHLKLPGSFISPDDRAIASGNDVILPPRVMCQVFFLFIWINFKSKPPVLLITAPNRVWMLNRSAVRSAPVAGCKCFPVAKYTAGWKLFHPLENKTIGLALTMQFRPYHFWQTGQ